MYTLARWTMALLRYYTSLSDLFIIFQWMRLNEAIRRVFFLLRSVININPTLSVSLTLSRFGCRADFWDVVEETVVGAADAAAVAGVAETFCLDSLGLPPDFLDRSSHPSHFGTPFHPGLSFFFLSSELKMSFYRLNMTIYRNQS